MVAYGYGRAISVTDILHEPPAPDGPATRSDVEAVLLGRDAPVRFVGWNLNGIDLSRLDLWGCAFVRCRAGGADFSFCDLTEGRFESCDLNNTNWHGASLSSGIFQDCKLTGAQFADARTLGLVFARCLLINAQLHKFSFRKTSLDTIDFQGADLTEADFRNATFVGCNLRDANVTHARFEGADLRGADLGNLRLADASRFKGAVISKQQAAVLLSGLGLKVV